MIERYFSELRLRALEVARQYPESIEATLGVEKGV